VKTITTIAAAALLSLAPAGAVLAQDTPPPGQRVFNQCRACHTINEGGRNGVGPNLWGIIDQQAGQRAGFRYSANMQQLAAGGLRWDAATLGRYLTNPKDVVPQGSMAFAGLRNPADVEAVVAWISTQK
jgi:cytochrome c